MTCPMCKCSEAVGLGRLGALYWLRCRACGMDYSITSDPPGESTSTPDADAGREGLPFETHGATRDDLIICRHPDHNDEGGCPNPDCFKHPRKEDNASA